MLSSINWFSVLIAFMAYFLLGALWYRRLFLQLYKVSLGKADQILDNQRPRYIVSSGQCVLATVIASAILFCALGISSYPQALVLAGLVGGGFLVANTTNIAINPNIPRPFLYSSITSGYHLLDMTLTRLILMAMR